MPIEPSQVLSINSGLVGAIVILLAISSIGGDNTNDMHSALKQLSEDDEAGKDIILQSIQISRQFLLSPHVFGVLLIIPFALAAFSEVGGFLNREDDPSNSRSHGLGLMFTYMGFLMLIVMSIIAFILFIIEWLLTAFLFL